MNYFEINEPYYALLKAENVEEATKKYVEVVAGDEEERPLIANNFEEIDRDYAFVKFARCLDESNGILPITQVVDDFNYAKSEVLIMDSTLL